MANIFPIDFEEKLTMAQDDYILFSDSEDGNKIKKAQYRNLKGEQGTPGADGSAATITVGSVTTGAAGSSATVVNSGTTSAAVLDFTIPQGVAGTPGADGNDGAAATITVGTTTTLPAGSSATVTNSGTSSAAVLNFGIPKGDAGTGSGDVSGPASSTDGNLAVFDGVTGKIIKDGGAIPTGFTPSNTGTTGQVLKKTASGYEWDDESGAVTSVNGNTGAVTISEFTASAGGTKVFDYPTTSVEDIVTWCNGGGTAILMKSDGPYVVSKVGTSYITSVRDNSGDGGTFGTGSVKVDMLTYDNTYALTSSNNVVTYNHFHPGGTATTGYVVTKTANGYEWAATSKETSTITVTLTSAGWSSNAQTVTATGVTATNTVICSPVPSSMSDYTAGGVYCSTQATDSLTFECDTEPTNDIVVNVVIIS